jgi:hypothetical protein
MALRRGAFACLLGALTCAPITAFAAPVLRDADVRVEYRSPTRCVVDLTVSVDGATQVEHRVEVVDGARVELSELRGAVQLGEAWTVGRTRALVVRPAGAAYTVRYAVEQPPSSASRCPLWIPSVPADGRSQAVAVRVRIPAGATAAGTMPGFSWVGDEGTARLGHLPAFVMDVVAIGTLVLASAAWARRRPRPGLAR